MIIKKIKNKVRSDSFIIKDEIIIPPVRKMFGWSESYSLIKKINNSIFTYIQEKNEKIIRNKHFYFLGLNIYTKIENIKNVKQLK